MYKLLCVCSYVVHRYDIVTSRSVHTHIYIHIYNYTIYITYMYISSASLQAVETRVQHWYGETSCSFCQHSSSPRLELKQQEELKPRGVQRKTLKWGCRKKKHLKCIRQVFQFHYLPDEVSASRFIRRHGFPSVSLVGMAQELSCHAISRLTLGILVWNVTVETFWTFCSWDNLSMLPLGKLLCLESCNPDDTYLDDLRSRYPTLGS